ncbi:MAG TPA: ADP-ribosylglycohydrolase family protein [Acidimicrobiales bacterium]|nr:ADP-ribosylglycohydrolase family protein [Acidimicrobiales bacterium]
MTTAEDRAVGALVGLAAGDAVGTTLEFRRPGTFEPITDLVGGGPFDLRAGAWTDDTSMALCLAESLADTGDMDLADQVRRYVAWRRDGYLSSTGTCFDIGGTTAAQLTRFERTGVPVDPSPDPEAAANGSLMRLAPVPIRWHADVEEAAARSAESSRTTHAADRPVDACRVLGAMTAALVAGADAGDVLDPGFWQWGPLHPAVEAVTRGSWQGKEPPAIRGTGYCVDALEAAIWAVAGAADFREAVLRAANLGDDADTTAAIAGQLAGARWGAEGIPARWRAKLVFGARITELARSLFRAGGGDTSPGWPHDDLLHAWWVDEHVLAGEYPASLAEPVRSEEKLHVLVDAGVRTFVDLTTPEDQLEPYAHRVVQAADSRRLDLRHVNVPIPDLGVLEDHRYDDIVRTIDEHRARGGVYVHCWGGVGRTGTVIGCILADEGHDHASIEQRLRELRAGTRKADRRCPETEEQRAVIRRRARGSGDTVRRR